MKIIIFLLKVNATNIVQHLEIEVFKTFNATLKIFFDKHIIETSSPPLTKREAIALSSKAREEGATRRIDNIVSGFRSSGICPNNFTLLMNRLNIYQGGGLPTKLEEPKEWIKCRETIRADILQNPHHQRRQEIGGKPWIKMTGLQGSNHTI